MCIQRPGTDSAISLAVGSLWGRHESALAAWGRRPEELSACGGVGVRCGGVGAALTLTWTWNLTANLDVEGPRGR
jgi:hypothetical protein